MTHHYRITTTAVIPADWMQRPGDGLPNGNYYTGYSRLRKDADDLARADRRQGGKPTVERVEV